MSKVGSWSTTPGNNNSTPPDGWPEGQAPSTVNDCAREMMASIRTYLSDAQYFDPNNTPSFLTTTTFSLGAADTSTFKVGKRIKLFDATTLYGTIDSVSATFVSVRLDSGALTASLSSCAVAIVDNSLPEQAYRHRNVIINGNMDIWQRGTSFAFSGGAQGAYTADRWVYAQSAGATVNVTRAERSASAANVPTVALAGMLIDHALRISVSAVDATIGATEYSTVIYRVEGYDWRQIAHRPNVLSFFANSNRSGIYGVSLRNAPASASYLATFTIDTVSTWQRYSITIPEAPTSVTWNYSQSTGAVVTICLAAGSSWQGTGGAWTAADLLTTSAQQNFLATAGNVMRLTGFMLHDGTQATPLQVRPYGEELALCHRYYWRGLPSNIGFNFPAYTAAATQSWPVSFPVTMRVQPSMGVAFSGITLSGLQGNPSIGAATVSGYRIIATASAAGVNISWTWGASDYIEADGEL